MEKLIPIINWVKHNRFWLVCALVAITMVAMWFVATQATDKLADSNKSKVTSKISSANSVINYTAEEGVRAHPNSTTQDGMKAEMAATIDSVMRAWEKRYDDQKESFKWPDVLSADFVEQFSKFNPPETFPVGEDEDGNDLGIKYSRQLEAYLKIFNRQIPESMREITAIINTEWEHLEDLEAEKEEDDESNSRGSRGQTPMAMDEIDTSIVVQWHEENQDLWNAKLSSFRNRDDNRLQANIPTPLQVYMLQQDLSLLRAMFNIIDTVNRDDSGEKILSNDFAKIKKIDHVAFGRDLDPLTGQLETVDSRLSMAQAEDDSGMLAGRGGRTSMGDLSGGSMGGGTGVGGGDLFDFSEDRSPFHGRYVNADFERIKASEVRDVLTGKTLPSSGLELVVAKRVPVRIAVRMDERSIDDFIAASANSPVVFEISQVRLNRHEAMEGIKLGGSEGGALDDYSSRGDESQESNIGTSGMAGGDTGGNSEQTTASGEIGPVETRTTYDVTVEFYGIVKIYNPPNRAILEASAGFGGADPTDANP